MTVSGNDEYRGSGYGKGKRKARPLLDWGGLTIADATTALDGRSPSASHVRNDVKSARRVGECRFKMIDAIKLPRAREYLTQIDRVAVVYVCV